MKKIDYGDMRQIKFFYPDLALSKEFCTKFKGLINSKECYDNVFRIVKNHWSLTTDYTDLLIVYGGVQVHTNDGSESNLFVRHCFFRLQDSIIDPTMSMNKLINEQDKYFSVIEFSISEYLDMLEKECHTSPITIMKELNKASLDLLCHNIFYAG